MTSDNGMRTESIGYSSGGGEAIDPGGEIVDKSTHHISRELGKMKECCR